MFASRVKCRVLETRWATPSVFLVRFVPSRQFTYLPGQFLSVVVPAGGRQLKRCYSFSSSPEESRRTGHYELCVKLVPGGAGSSYLSGLKPGDKFSAFAPYGGFTYRTQDPTRTVVFIATSTGIAPFRSMLASRLFQENRPARTVVVFGARDEKELLYERDMRQLGVETVYAISRPAEGWTGFKGRVTEYLRQLPVDFPWHRTDFYLCGNGEMVQEVNEILRSGRGVSSRSIHQENFSPPRPNFNPGVVVVEEDDESLVPLALTAKQSA